MIKQYSSDEPGEPLHEYIKVDYSDDNIEWFCAQLSYINWERWNYIRDVNQIYDAFVLLYE